MNLSNLFLQMMNDNPPEAIAVLSGSSSAPALEGKVFFYALPIPGVLILAEISGLPDQDSPIGSHFFAMHIHEFGDCTLPFDKTGMHYNPGNQPHPEHAGDLLPLMSSRGYAWAAFFDERFTIREILGRSVILHLHRDDFTTQPSGDAGEKIGCGKIRKYAAPGQLQPDQRQPGQLQPDQFQPGRGKHQIPYSMF